MATILLSLGSNQGDRIKQCRNAIENIKERFPAEIKKVSSFYETQALGPVDQEDYINMALEITTDLPPMSLLRSIREVETLMGRRKLVKWGSRDIDIDIIFYDDLVMRSDNLTIPHLLMQERRFVLEPLSEIEPNLIHPLTGKTISQMAKKCKDPLWVKKLDVKQATVK